METRLSLPIAAAVGGALFLLAACDDTTRPTAPNERRAPPAEGEAGQSPGALFTITTRDLGTLGGRESRAIGNYDNGVVVGWSLTAAGQKRAFKWTVGGGMRALSTLAPGKPCQANHVTENGQIAGFCFNASGKERAVLWSAANGMQSLGTLPGGTKSQANDINNHQQVVGSSNKTGGAIQTTLWTLH